MNFTYLAFEMWFLIIWLTLSIFLTLLPIIVMLMQYCGSGMQYLKLQIIHILCKKLKFYSNIQIKVNKNEFDNLDEVSIHFDKKTERASEISTQNDKNKEEKNSFLFSKIVKAHNLKLNIFELFYQAPPEMKNYEALRIFDLLKIISCGIIIFYHSSNMRGPRLPEETTTVFALIYGMGQIVDVFYWISGFLNFLSLNRRFSQIFKQNKVRFFPIFLELVWGRFIRIYAPYVFSLIYLIAAHSQFFEWQTEGNGSLINRVPFLYEEFAKSDFCWENFFMVSNHKCMQFAWYMADDLFIYAIFVIVLYIPFYLSQKLTSSCFKGGPLIFIFVLGSLLLSQLCSFFILSQNGFSFSDYFPSLYPMPSCFNENKKFFFFFFTISPVTRYYAFAFGAILGFAFDQYSSKNIKQKIGQIISQKRCIWKIIIHSLGIIFLISCYFIGFLIWKWVFLIAKQVQYQADLWTSAQHFQYLLWWRFLILIGLTIVILPCLLSIPLDPMRIFLKIRWPFSPLSKLTYCAYLFHIYVIEISMFISGENNNMVKKAKPSLEEFIFDPFSYDLLIAFGVAFFVYLLIELPIRNLCKSNSQPKNRKNTLQEKDLISEHKSIIEMENPEMVSTNPQFPIEENKKSEDVIQVFKADDYKKNMSKSVKSFVFFLVFLAFSISLHFEVYKELIQNTNNIRGCSFSLIQNSSNCSLNINSQTNENPRIYLDTAYGVCVENCRDDRYLLTVTNSCVPQCPKPYFPSEQKHCCSPLCITCNRSNINECFTCRYFSFRSLCVLECPAGTVSNLNNECLFCDEIDSSAPYYDFKSRKCNASCNSPQVIYTVDNHSQCLENCPEGTQKQLLADRCCDQMCEECSENDYRECIYKDNKACSNKTWFWQFSERICVETCPQNLTTFASRKLCLENCSSIDPTMRETTNKVCCKIGCEECSFENDNNCSKCSTDSFFFLNTSSCVLNCPLGYKFELASQSCETCSQGALFCDILNLDKWCKPQFFLSKESTCNAYCPAGNPDSKNQFCCDESDVCERVKLEKIYSLSMKKYIPFFLFLPKNWETAKNETFPVVLVYHGNSNNFARFALQNLKFARHNENFLLVFPDGDVNTYFVDSPIDPRIRFETFITTELRPFLIQNYRAKNDRKWANVGPSSGGFAALALAMKHRDKFCVACSFGPIVIISHNIHAWSDNLLIYRFGNLSTAIDNYIPFNWTWIAENTTLQNHQLNIFFTSFKDDKIGEVGNDTRKFHEYLDSKNISHHFEQREGVKHIDGWEDRTISEAFPFILNSLQNNCE